MALPGNFLPCIHVWISFNEKFDENLMHFHEFNDRPLAATVPPSWLRSYNKWLKNEGVVSKETVLLRRWGSSIQKFGFINGVDNVNWPPYRDSKS